MPFVVRIVVVCRSDLVWIGGDCRPPDYNRTEGLALVEVNLYESVTIDSVWMVADCWQPDYNGWGILHN